MTTTPKLGEIVTVPWGLSDIKARVTEIYGAEPKLYVVVMLTPELSGDVVDEPTTLSLPLDAVSTPIPA